eukprot:365359-Chlamydomonas_euryale.AAC.5
MWLAGELLTAARSGGGGSGVYVRGITPTGCTPCTMMAKFSGGRRVVSGRQIALPLTRFPTLLCALRDAGWQQAARGQRPVGARLGDHL